MGAHERGNTAPKQLQRRTINRMRRLSSTSARPNWNGPTRSASFLLCRHKAAIGKLPPPCFDAITRRETDIDRDLVSRIRKSKQVRDESGEQSGAAVDFRHSFGLKLTLEVMHGTPRRRHALERVAEQAAIERHRCRQARARARIDMTTRKQGLIVGQFHIVGCRSCTGGGAATGEAIADDDFGCHRRNERPVVAFRDHVPGAFGLLTQQIDSLDQDEHAAAMFAPAQEVGRAMHE